jgi:dihydrodipicolinate synthase/N-acetylneuraminate lyase
VEELTISESMELAKHAEKCGIDRISPVRPIYYSGMLTWVLEHDSRIGNSTNLAFLPRTN